MINTSHTYGVWGYGTVGQSVVQYLLDQGASICLMEKRRFTLNEQLFFDENNVATYRESHKDLFFQSVDYIIPSPGIDISRYYQQYVIKWRAEVDLFASTSNASQTTASQTTASQTTLRPQTIPIVGITGSVGKTTITSLVQQIGTWTGMNAQAIGNIGVPLLEGLKNYAGTSTTPHLSVVELSSFQLEYAQQFAPDIGVVTNVSPNHLDRHRSYDAYVSAKLRLFARQTKEQYAIVPWELRQHPKLATIKSEIAWHTQKPLHAVKKEAAASCAQHAFFLIDKNIIIKYQNKTTTPLLPINVLPPITFVENWVVIAAILDRLRKLMPKQYLKKTIVQTITEFLEGYRLPTIAHRMELVPVSSQGASLYYNDSKATTPAATRGAIDCITTLLAKSSTPRRFILFLGGLDKGVDRTPLITHCVGRVTALYTFGAQAQELAQMASQYALPVSPHATLEQAFADYAQARGPADVVLFSPSGSSFDLFCNYQERGDRFKKLVMHLHATGNH